ADGGAVPHRSGGVSQGAVGDAGGGLQDPRRVRRRRHAPVAQGRVAGGAALADAALVQGELAPLADAGGGDGGAGGGRHDRMANRERRRIAMRWQAAMSLPTRDGAEMHLRLPGILAARPMAMDFIASVCHSLHVPLDVEHAMLSAVGEAFNNVVVHSYRDVAGEV